MNHMHNGAQQCWCAPLDEIMAVTGHNNEESVKRYLHHRRDDQMYNLSCVLETARSGTKRTCNVDNCATSGSGSGERIVVEKDML